MTVGQAHLLDDIISLVGLLTTFRMANNVHPLSSAGAGSRRGSRNLRTNDVHVRIG